MGKKFAKRSFTTQEISEIVSRNTSLKTRNKKVIEENKSFLDSAKSYKESKEDENLFLPKRKINEKHREAVIDSIFNEDESIDFTSAFKTPQNKIESNPIIEKAFNSPELKVFKEKPKGLFLSKILPFLDSHISSFIEARLNTVFNYIDAKLKKIYEDISAIAIPNKNMIPMGGIFIDRTSGQVTNPINPKTGNPNIIILNDGIQLDTKVNSLNFIGVGVKVYTDSNGNINIFIPPTLLSPFFNSGAATISPENTVLRNISFPTSEGVPFKRGSIVGKFQTIHNSIISYTTINPFSVLNNTSTILTLRIYDADLTTILEELNLTLTGNLDTGIINGLRIQTTGFINEANKYSSIASFYIDLNTILSGNSGRVKIEIIHNNLSDGIYTFTQDLFYDSQNLLGSIGSILVSQNTPNIKYLSGIAYYDLGSSFNLNISNISNHNSDSYPDTQLRVSSPNLGIPNKDYNGASDFIGFTNFFDDSNDSIADSLLITQNNYRYRGTQGKIQGRILDWIPENLVDSGLLSILIDTYGTTSSQYIRTFDDEFQRYLGDYTTLRNSSTPLGASEALIFDGFLMAPNKGYFRGESSSLNSNWTGYYPNPMSQPNYTSLIALPVSYYTKISDNSIDKSSFTLTFIGSFVSGNALGDLLSGDLKIFIRRVNGNGNIGTACPPLRLHGGYYNFSVFDDGTTIPGSLITEGSSVGNIINATFGGLSCRNGIYMEIQLNNANIKIDNLKVDFF